MHDQFDKPTYEQVVSYYLRDDVLEYFWNLSQTRQLKFFHHCNTDPQSKTIRAKPAAIDVHRPESLDQLRGRILKVTNQVPSYDYDFFPFWGIQSSQVNHVDNAEIIIGWDMRFEFDFDLWYSFAILIPVAAILKAYDIPVNLKYSGHRSLHLIIPAEAFPLSMKTNASREMWLEAADDIAYLCYRIAPYMTTTHAGLSKEMILTAPYSFHRYFGLVSVPLSLDQCFDFDPTLSLLENINETNWVFPDQENEGSGMEELLSLAKRARSDDEVLFEIASHTFKGDIWKEFIMRQNPPDILGDSVNGVLMAGFVAISQLQKYPEPLRSRLKLALLAMDDPIVKTHKFAGLVDSPLPFNLPISMFIKQRRVRTELMSIWVESGLEAAINYLLHLARDHNYASPVLLATRLLGILPENNQQLSDILVDHWNTNYDDREILAFLGLSLAERATPSLLNELVRYPDHTLQAMLEEKISNVDQWQAESRPDIVLTILLLIFGKNEVNKWIKQPDSSESKKIIKSIFNNKYAKLVHATKNICVNI